MRFCQYNLNIVVRCSIYRICAGNCDAGVRLSVRVIPICIWFGILFSGLNNVVYIIPRFHVICVYKRAGSLNYVRLGNGTLRWLGWVVLCFIC